MTDSEYFHNGFISIHEEIDNNNSNNNNYSKNNYDDDNDSCD